MPKITGFQLSFRMKQLPKAEYAVMKAMIEQYKLNDPSELFTALLRLAVETQTLAAVDGAAWLQRLVTESVSDTRQ